MSDRLLRGGRVIDPANGLDGLYDILIAGAQIEAVKEPGQMESAEVAAIDASGLWILPGLIDPHVHLRDPGFPGKETIASGLRAAAAGGFTAVAAMANTSPVNDSPEITRYMLDRADEVGAARLIAVSAVTRGLRGTELVDFDAMVAAGVRLFSDDGIPIDDPVILRDALDAARRVGFALSLHEEDRELSREGAVNAGEISKRLGVTGYPEVAETSRIRRDLALAIGTEAPVHIAHLSCAESIELIRSARKQQANVTCEVTPHHFVLDQDAVMRFGPSAKMNPPLRTGRDIEAIRVAMGDGTIDMIATDHAPHDSGAKQLEILAKRFPMEPTGSGLKPEDAELFMHAANGVVGLETAVGLAIGLVHQGILSASRLVEMMSLNPARLLRLEAGALSHGMRADVTIIDPDFQWTVEPERFKSLGRNTPFAAMRLRGKTVYTIVNGETVYQANRVKRG